MIDIQVDYKDAVRFLTDVEKKQIPFAEAKALNATWLEVQVAQRANLHAKFTLRRPTWAEKSVKLSHFATKKEPWVTFGFHPLGDESKRDILGKFESTTIKRPIEGRTIAVPVADSLKRKGTGIIPHKNRPSGLNFHRVGNRVVGDRGTFIVRKPDGSGFILQRLGRGRGRRGGPKTGVQLLYLLVPSVRITPNLEFAAISSRVVDKRWVPNFLKAFDDAMRTAK